jgi:hypothetical protein
MQIAGDFTWVFRARARAFVSAGNVLLLKNVINLNPDAGEVSQQKLLSLVAERLIDSNSTAQVRSPLSRWDFTALAVRSWCSFLKTCVGCDSAGQGR